MSETIRVQGTLPASAELVFRSWLSGPEHTSMTGAKTTYERDGSFNAWDGYIHGRTLSVEAPRRILQAWRSAEFPADAPDSLLEILLTETPEGTELTLLHSEIPDGQGPGYQGGWQEYYLLPMTEYFRAMARKPPRPLPALAPQPQAPRVATPVRAQAKKKAAPVSQAAKVKRPKAKLVVKAKPSKARPILKKAKPVVEAKAKAKAKARTVVKRKLAAAPKKAPSKTSQKRR